MEEVASVNDEVVNELIQKMGPLIASMKDPSSLKEKLLQMERLFAKNMELKQKIDQWDSENMELKQKIDQWDSENRSDRSEEAKEMTRYLAKEKAETKSLMILEWRKYKQFCCCLGASLDI